MVILFIPPKGTDTAERKLVSITYTNLNYFDLWIDRQWEEGVYKKLVPQYNSK